MGIPLEIWDCFADRVGGNTRHYEVLKNIAGRLATFCSQEYGWERDLPAVKRPYPSVCLHSCLVWYSLCFCSGLACQELRPKHPWECFEWSWLATCTAMGGSFRHLRSFDVRFGHCGVNCLYSTSKRSTKVFQNVFCRFWTNAVQESHIRDILPLSRIFCFRLHRVYPELFRVHRDISDMYGAIARGTLGQLYCCSNHSIRKYNFIPKSQSMAIQFNISRAHWTRANLCLWANKELFCLFHILETR